MNARLLWSFAALCLCLGGAAEAAGTASITLKKQDEGALELSNLADEDEGEVLVEGKDVAPAELATAASEEAARQPRGRDRLPVERGERASRPDAVARDEGGRDEERRGAEHLGEAGPGGASSAMGYVNAAAAPATTASANGGSSASGSSGSHAPPLVSVDPNVNAVAPNPRAANDNAVPYSATTSDTTSQERYAARMVQEAAAATAARTTTAMENPAAVRRYLMVDRATYQTRTGR
jgi:hypothetical protein